MIRRLFLAAVLILFGGASHLVFANAITDPVGDFLPTFTGPHDGDLDVVSAHVVYNGPLNAFTLTATLNGIIDTTNPALLYVWGFDRGAGLEIFQINGPPATGAGVFFDSVVAFVPNAGISVVVNDVLNPVQVVAGGLTIHGKTISGVIDAALLPNLPGHGGFGDYTYNLWPRLGLGDNTGISDFAPDGSNAKVDVTEPGTLFLLAMGMVAILIARRRASRL